MKENIKHRIHQLRENLHAHNHQYYILDSPTISDQEFDQLLKELADLEAAHPEFLDTNSPTQRVGGGITKNLPNVLEGGSLKTLELSCIAILCILWTIPIPKKNFQTG